jgi:hypothetical protein
MKKTYQTPAMFIVRVKTHNIICSSGDTMRFGGNANGSTTVDARESIWDDEEEW